MKKEASYSTEFYGTEPNFLDKLLDDSIKSKKDDELTFADISKSWKKRKKSSLTAVDIFCGCGGISKGLELAGIEVIAGLDFFLEAGETYKTNFKHKFVYGDVTKREIKQELYNTIKKELNGRQLNIVAGGFPCQGFSMSGRRELDDPRNKLYLEMIEIVKKLQPEFLFLENVKGLTSMAKGKVKEKILRDFQNIGYKIQAYVLNSADFETPQKRERVVFIGNRIGKKILYPKALITNDKYFTTKDAIEDLMSKDEDIEFSHFITKHSKEMQKRLLEVEEGKGLYSNYSDSWKKCLWNEASCTIKENHGGVNIHPKLPRVLTVRECARIQSFPDNFLFKGTKSKQLVQVGNAVPPNLAKAVGLAIVKTYDE